jgi:hypothetical protein
LTLIPPRSDYRGLKKRITAIRLAQEQEDGATPLNLPTTPLLNDSVVQTHSRPNKSDDQPILSPNTSLTEVEQEGYEQDEELEQNEIDANKLEVYVFLKSL